MSYLRAILAVLVWLLVAAAVKAALGLGDVDFFVGWVAATIYLHVLVAKRR